MTSNSDTAPFFKEHVVEAHPDVSYQHRFRIRMGMLGVVSCVSCRFQGRARLAAGVERLGYVGCYEVVVRYSHLDRDPLEIDSLNFVQPRV
jgi:hypothetical protein